MSTIVVTNGTVTRPLVGAATNSGTPVAYLKPKQVVGLVPLYPCVNEDCRVNPIQPCVKPLLVFAGETYSSNMGTYENDCNSWLVDVQLYSGNNTATAQWVIQKLVSGAWVSQSSLNNTTFGHYWAFNTNTLNPSYTGIRLNWGKVYATYGSGYYRVRLSTIAAGLEDCLATPMFWLRPFDCEDAHYTVKFQTYTTGQIGSYGQPGKVNSLCGFSFIVGDAKANSGWYDEVRHYGFFGLEKITEYVEVQNEWQNGRIESVKNEAIQQWEFFSGLLGKDYHDRLKIYMAMADVKQVSDYNINNSDWNINQLNVVMASGYEPKYNDVNWNATHSVNLKFKAGYQSLIKSICCPTLR